MNLPKPDTSSLPIFISEEVKLCFYSKNNEIRALVTLHKDGTYRVRREKWCLTDYEYIKEGYWIEDGHFNTIADTLETGEILAKEGLDIE